jgi:hypothetical protein
MVHCRAVLKQMAPTCENNVLFEKPLYKIIETKDCLTDIE